MKFLRRYTADTVSPSSRLRGRFSQIEPVEVLHGDARIVDLPLEPTGIITSPPYPGLIDYHEQHRYAYELLGARGSPRRRDRPASRGQSGQAVRAYVDDMVAVFANARASTPGQRARHHRRERFKELYPEILERSGLRLEERLTRHVNRRTGRRAGSSSRTFWSVVAAPPSRLRSSPPFKRRSASMRQKAAAIVTAFDEYVAKPLAANLKKLKGRDLAKRNPMIYTVRGVTSSGRMGRSRPGRQRDFRDRGAYRHLARRGCANRERRIQARKRRRSSTRPARKCERRRVVRDPKRAEYEECRWSPV